jgi:hypothetical protein
VFGRKATTEDATTRNIWDDAMHSATSFRIATRIHFALLRQYSEDVAVSALLNGDAGAREALWVCEASGHQELVTLAQQLNAAKRDEARAARAAARSEAPKAQPAKSGAVAQDMAWAQDTSGFGVTRPLDADDAAPGKPTRWLSPSRWLRGSSTR